MPTFQVGPGLLRIEKQAVYNALVDMIVNAANERMRGGGGLDGVIHESAGPELLDELRKVAPNGAPAGVPILTGGFYLPQKYIAHVVGPRWAHTDSQECEAKLRSCYENVIRLGNALFLKSIAFPSISTGAFRYPLEEACPIALDVITHHLENCADQPVKEIVVSLFREDEFVCYMNTANASLAKAQPAG